MQLVIDNKSGRVLTMYPNDREVPTENFGDVEIIRWDEPFSFQVDDDGDLPRDPRSAEQKASAQKERFLAHGPVYVDTIRGVDGTFPEPKES